MTRIMTAERRAVTGASGKVYIATAQKTGVRFGWLGVIKHASNGRVVKVLDEVYGTHMAALAVNAAERAAAKM